jgi:hypothetical protein
MLVRRISKSMPLVTSQNMSKGNFWGWVNMIFNRVDRSRLKKVGAERLCTEWLLKNGAAVRFTTTQPGQIHTDYNSLPSDKLPFPFKIKEVIGELPFSINCLQELIVGIHSLQPTIPESWRLDFTISPTANISIR